MNFSYFKLKKLNFKNKKIIMLVLLFTILFNGCGYEKRNDVIYQVSSSSNRQCMGYIIHDKNDHTIVIDGGTEQELNQIVNIIKEIDDDNTVDGWFLTHYHDDHTGALAKYLKDESNEITIKHIYHQLAEQKMVSQYESNRRNDIDNIKNALDKVKNVSQVHKNDIMNFGNIQVEVLRDVDNAITKNYGNNTSIVYKVMVNDTSILFLGDLGAEASPAFLEENKDKIRNMDYLQLAHHGQAGGSKELYQWINPKYCLWPTPSWLYENKDGVYRIEETKEWISSLHVKKNYYAFKETDNEIEFNDE